MRIYCSNCGWQPVPESRWGCTCGHAWNTFDTRARCPDCKKQWSDTQCLDCQAWSPHQDWYHGKEAIDLSRKKSKTRERVDT